MKRRACVIAALGAVAVFALSGACVAQTGNSRGGETPAPSPPAAPSPSPDLQEQLLLAQIANQKAQTSYYERQFSQSLLTAVQSLLAALAGAGLAFYGLWLQGRRQERVERDRWEREQTEEDTKWRRAKEDERLKETRLALAELAKAMTAAVQSMTWILWIAKFDFKNFNIGHVREHDKRMNKIYTELVGRQAALAALDEDVYRRTDPSVKLVYYYDAEIARVVAKSELTDLGDLMRLGSMWQVVYDFSNDIPNIIARIMRLREAEPTAAGGPPAAGPR
ncbi:MAG TPA: hypothetical protein VJ866_22845 [Pyrinomonadaceae bacterium]|nr:hypothetical protein [Pyrinomonadaceae bacterium]